MAALAPSASIARAANVFNSNARSYRAAWRATIVVSFISPLLFLLAVGVLLGELVDRGNADLGGLTYLEFVAPGLLAAMAMQVGVNEGSFPVMAGIRWARTYHAVIATPASVGELVTGVLGWIAARVAVAAVLFSAIAGAAGAFTSWLAVFAPAAALLCGLAFGSLIACLAAALEDHAVMTAVFRFGILPLFLFSGTFFPLSRLPDWLEPVAWATPLWHGVELCRDLAHGNVGAGSTAVHVAYLVVAFAIGAVLTVRFLSRRLLR